MGMIAGHAMGEMEVSFPENQKSHPDHGVGFLILVGKHLQMPPQLSIL